MAAVLFEGTPAIPFRAGGPRTAAQIRHPDAPASRASRLSLAPGPRPAQPSALAQADGGTLFLGSSPCLWGSSSSSCLVCRGPQDRTRAARLASASSPRPADLQCQARSGTFCAQLFYRLAIVPVHLPPLRQCGRDIALLATHFVRQARSRVGRPDQPLSADLLDALQEHEWRGNVWKLKRCCQQLALVPGIEPVTPERVARLLQAAPWADGLKRRPVSRWTSPWQRSAGRN